MPDPSQSTALIRSRITNPKDVREIETIEIIQPSVSYQNEQLDIVFVVDDTGSMSSVIESVVNSLTSAVEQLSVRFSSVRFGLVTFKDQDEIYLVPNSSLRSKEEIESFLNAIVSSGGDDTEEAGYHATVRACNEILWRQQSSVYRCILLVTDAPSHERGSTEEEAISALLNKKVKFYFTTISSDTTYDNLALDSGGEQIPYSYDSEEFSVSLVEALLRIETYTGKDPIYLVNDGYEFEAKTETELEVTYLPRAFDIKISGEGTTGVRSINITIDNTDLQVSKYLASAIKNNLPIEVVYRSYLSNDPEYPQNDPPLRVFLTNVEISGNIVAGELNWIDLTNSAFPNAYYTEDRFPGL
jgi:hypothetical protein